MAAGPATPDLSDSGLDIVPTVSNSGCTVVLPHALRALALGGLSHLLAPVRPLRHPAAPPRLHQADNPADGRKEPVAGPGEAHGDHEPAPDAEPHAPVHVQRPLSTRDEPRDTHPEPGDDHDHRQEGEAHRGGGRPELTGLQLRRGGDDPLSSLIRRVQVRRDDLPGLPGDLLDGPRDPLLGALLDPLHRAADPAHELPVLLGLRRELLNRRGRSRVILLRLGDQTLRGGAQPLPVETLHELGERLLDLGQPALDALDLR